jgi:TELO2-interacting protein 1
MNFSFEFYSTLNNQGTDHLFLFFFLVTCAACASLSTSCSFALSGCLPVFMDVILALAQDSWPSVAAAARSSLNTKPTETLSPTISSSVLILATAEMSLKTWIHELPAALRRGDEAGKAHALKITTCLEACPPAWIANHLLSHSTEVGRLINVLSNCFAIDADSTGLLLVAAPEAAGTAFTPASTSNTSSSSTPCTSSLNSSVSVSLPRMPLGLQYISTQKTYDCVASMVRTLAAVAVLADNTNSNSGTSSTGGTALRSLIDGCLQHIQRLVDTSSLSNSEQIEKESRRPGAGVKKNKKEDLTAAMDIDRASDILVGDSIVAWTISAAQIVFVLNEIIFGASPAWQPRYSLLSATASSSSSSSFSSSPSFTKEIEALLASVLPELVDMRIWSLPTAISSNTMSSSFNTDNHHDNIINNSYNMTPPAAALPSTSPGFISKDRGSNAALHRAILDCIGTSARALGLQFTNNGRLLRSILLPVIQKMGDPCPIVAASADTTIQAICTFCGYSQTTTSGGLRQLVADNADYIVDGLCRQLRQPEIFPQAPQLFAALLRQGGVAPGLVPLLAEPARQALLGISIVARKKKPEHVLSFVLCLREIGRGAGLVAKETCADVENFVVLIEERRELLLEKIKEKKVEEERVKIGVVKEVIEPVSEYSDNKMEEINKYFKDYLAHKQRTADKTTSPDTQNMEEDDLETDDDLKIPVLLEEWNQIQISRQKAASCATLAQSASDTASPLILSSALPVAIQSIKTCSEALEALKYASKGVEICAKQIDPVVMPPGGIVGPTPDPTKTAFLPSVHLLWSPLMGALSDWRVAVVESALSMLNHVSYLAGSFLTRRFSEEAWPKMQRLLKEGPSQRRIIAPGQDDLSSPAVVQRAQRAVLACVRDIATGGEGSEAIITPVAGAVLVAAADLMGEKHPAVIREHATNAFVAISGVDPDAAWGLLVAAIRTSHSAAATAAKIDMSSSNGGAGAFCPSGLPPMSDICPAPSTSSTTAEKFVPKGLRACGETKLLALLKQVTELPVPWHRDVEKLLDYSDRSTL